MKKYYFKCPRCKSDDSFKQVSERSNGTGCALFIFGGFIPALIYGASRAGRIQCSNCNHIFRQPSLPQFSISLLSVSIFSTMLISISIMILFYFVPDLFREVPNLKPLKILEDFIRSNPMGTAIGMIIMLLGILVLITFASGISNYRFRKDFKSKYLVSPEPNMVKNLETNKANSVDAKSRAAD